MSAQSSLLVPDDNLRLPDAITIKHGPAELLSRFILDSDRQARRKGIRLRLRNDFEALVDLNASEIKKGNWYPLAYTFDCRQTNLTRENAFWISGENEAGEIILCQGVRIYHWPNSNLVDEVRLMFYGGNDFGQQCEVTASGARDITGWAYYGGSLWIRPDYRGLKLSHLLPRVARAYAATRWPLDWSFAMVWPDQIEKGICAGYGYTDVTWSIYFPKSPIGEANLALVRMSAPEIYADLERYLSRRLAAAA